MNARAPLPVFFDPERKRWPRLRLGLAVLWFSLSLILGALVASVLISPALPALALPPVSWLPHGAHALPAAAPTDTHHQTGRERALHQSEAKLQKERERALQEALTPAHSTRHSGPSSARTRRSTRTRRRVSPGCGSATTSITRATARSSR